MTDAETAAYIAAAAHAAGLDIPSDAVAGTAANFARIASMAALVNALELDDTTEPAPVFRHD